MFAEPVRLGADPLREAVVVEQVGLEVPLDVVLDRRPVVVDREQVPVAVLGVEVRVRDVPLALVGWTVATPLPSPATLSGRCSTGTAGSRPSSSTRPRVFFDSRRSVRTSAKRLGLHENTIRYRLSRVLDLTGLDVTSDTDTQLTVQVALSILHIQGRLPTLSREGELSC